MGQAPTFLADPGSPGDRHDQHNDHRFAAGPMPRPSQTPVAATHALPVQDRRDHIEHIFGGITP